jgi:hypothetical protein
MAKNMLVRPAYLKKLLKKHITCGVTGVYTHH